MLGCHLGRMFQVTVAGGSYQEGLTTVVQGMPPGLPLSEQDIYADLLLRKCGADELSSPWSVAEAYTAMVILDMLMMHYGYQQLRQILGK